MISQDVEVPADWKKGVIIKLPKKGSLKDCNNWRGITLLFYTRQSLQQSAATRVQYTVVGLCPLQTSLTSGFWPPSAADPENLFGRNTTHGERAEREPITGVMGAEPQRGPGTDPPEAEKHL